MTDDNSDSKLIKNTTHVAAVSALNKIRTLVDGIEDQERKNKRRSIVVLIVFPPASPALRGPAAQVLPPGRSSGRRAVPVPRRAFGPASSATESAFGSTSGAASDRAASS